MWKIIGVLSQNLPVNAEDIRCQFNPWVRKIPCYIQFYLPSWGEVWVVAHFLLIIRDMVALDCILNGCWNFHVPFYVFFWSYGSKTSSVSSNKENPFAISCIVNPFSPSVTFSSSCYSLFFLWAHSHLWKLATFSFIYRGLTLVGKWHRIDHQFLLLPKFLWAVELTKNLYLYDLTTSPACLIYNSSCRYSSYR